MLPLPTVGPIELIIIAAIAIALGFGGGLVLRIVRSWKKRRLSRSKEP